MKELNIVALIILLLSSSSITAEVYYDSESGKNIDYHVSENGGILIDKSLVIKYELLFSNNDQELKKELVFNYKDKINNTYVATVENETNKLSRDFTGKAIIKNHFSDSKKSYTLKTIYTLKNGLINGKHKTYFNEKLLQKVSFSNDMANGNETIYWSNGIPAITGNWKDDYMTGKWIAYYVTGEKGLEWNMDNGVIKGKIQAWDILGKELASSNNKDGKFIHLYGTPIDYIYRVASPLHIIENKQKFTVSNYKNGRKINSSKVMFEITKKEFNLLKKYINKNKANEYAAYMSLILPKLGSP